MKRQYAILFVIIFICKIGICKQNSNYKDGKQFENSDLEIINSDLEDTITEFYKAEKTDTVVDNQPLSTDTVSARI
ncbi:MAG: hypothetical protein IPQ19_01135 [Bacteroidetes bacterium]|nr:hypothetical protein [Bacteroidota bacterium]